MDNPVLDPFGAIRRGEVDFDVTAQDQVENMVTLELIGDDVYFPARSSLEERRLQYTRRLSYLNTLINSYPHYINEDIFGLRYLLVTITSLQARTRIQGRLKLLERKLEMEHTIRRLDNLKKRKARYVFTESGVASSEASTGLVDPSVITHEENLTDAMGNDEDFQAVGSIQRNFGSINEKEMIANFLSRPVPIYSGQLLLNTDISLRLPVWDLFTSNPSVRAKFRNFLFLRATLHLNISVSGTPFHYGRLMVSYQPWASMNDALNTLLAIPTSFGQRNMNICYLSQAPGATTIDVKENKPTHMVCPFIVPKSKANLGSGTQSIIPAENSITDFAHMGDLLIYSIQQIKSVTSGTPSTPHMFVRAWFEDVEIAAPTGTLMNIETESGKELETGPVERFASSAQEVSSMLTSIPWLSPYAKASEMIFSAMGKVSTIFGWSKPIMNTNSVYVKNLAYRNGAQTIGPETNFKLSLDPKQELTVDARSACVEEDDMTIAYIANVESFLYPFLWSASDPPLTTILWRAGVSPYYSIRGADTLLASTFQPTAMSFAALPFNYWRGTIKYRLEVVASQYHRGKLMVGWEPNGRQINLIDDDLSTNKQYVQIIDIQETQNVEFCVEWCNDRAWLEAPADTLLNSLYEQAIGNYSIENWDCVNGIFFVTPYTELQSPDGSSIRVNVYVSSPDLCVNNYVSTLMPKSRKINTESGETTSPDAVSCFTLNGQSANEQGLFEEYFGERIVSFRSLLKRYQSYAYVTAAATDAEVVVVTIPRFPRPEIRFGNSVIAGSVKGNLYEYLRYAYLGMRGSTRHRVQLAMPAVASATDTAVFRNSAVSTTDAPPALTLSSSFTRLRCTHEGGATFVPHTNGGFEVDFPFYHNAKFLFSFHDQVDGQDITNNMIQARFMRNGELIMHTGYTGAEFTFKVLLDFAAGEDFTFLRFQGAPIWGGVEI